MTARNLKIKGLEFTFEQIAAIDVDVQNGFTPLCPGELPVEDGENIADELNKQATYAKWRVGSKDAHSLAAIYNATPKLPQLSPIEGEPNADVHWNTHCIVGTFGFQLIKGLPPVTGYDHFIWKGIELNMHPYGACYHDLGKKMSTGLIEWLKVYGVRLTLVGGLATDYCAGETAIELADAGFTVVYNLAAGRALTEKSLEAKVTAMKEKGIVVIPDCNWLQEHV